MNEFKLINEQISDFEKDGFLIIRNLLSKEEIEKLSRIAFDDNHVKENAIELNDQTGKKTKLTTWYTPGDDAFGLLTRSKSLIGAVDTLIDGNSEVCHYHSKLMQKEPQVGGAWEWHQDYGYWYKNEFLFPDQMLSVMIAITDANKENGCLQVIKGTHKMGRVEHNFSGEQVGASQHYVDLALKTMDHVYVELKEGDALFFHSNLLHRSDANLSDKVRCSLISCYNRRANKPYNEASQSSYTPLKTVSDKALLELSSNEISRNLDFIGKGQIHKQKL
jgi:ectoine hydroxylase-related dioxygenase (phytanoyl-CoA dioxygenase family)